MIERELQRLARAYRDALTEEDRAEAGADLIDAWSEGLCDLFDAEAAEIVLGMASPSRIARALLIDTYC